MKSIPTLSNTTHPTLGPLAFSEGITISPHSLAAPTHASSDLSSRKFFLLAGLLTTSALFLLARQYFACQLPPGIKGAEYVKAGTASEKMFRQTKYALSQRESKKWMMPDFRCDQGLKTWKACVYPKVTFSLEQEAFPKLRAAAAWMQGKRPTMEDEHLAEEITLQIGKGTHHARLFGVFDGHYMRDSKVESATELKDRLTAKLQACAEDLSSQYSTFDDIIPRAFTKAFIEIDQEIQNECAGTCAVCALEIDGRIYFPNCGDSRAILIQKERSVKMTEDARPLEKRFKRCIEREGHTVSGRGRVNDVLAPARDLGMPCVSARPKVSLAVQSNALDTLEEGIVHYQQGDLVVLACDGLWDAATTEEVAREVRLMRSQDLSLEQIASNLTKSALHSQDNVSVLLFEVGKPAQDPTAE